MKSYIGIKEVKAQLITAREAYEKGYKTGSIPLTKLGYEVEYEDGYKSFSPREPFEKAYSEINLETVSKENLQPHQERVVDEYNELIEKRNKLFLFFDNPIFKSLDQAEQQRLKNQFKAMMVYANILRERIINF
jgi:hypothetical protein